VRKSWRRENADRACNTMKRGCIFVLLVFALTPGVFAQDDAPIIKSEVMSAFVWGEDSPQARSPQPCKIH
jgi:hypothetical protein